MNHLHSLKVTAKAPENRPKRLSKEISSSKPSVFWRNCCQFSGRVTPQKAIPQFKVTFSNLSQLEVRF